jgi:hypothetical protein
MNLGCWNDSLQERERLGRSIYDEERLQVLNNALTESAVLHARTLCELFANPEGKFPTDIELQLSHLLPDWDWVSRNMTCSNGCCLNWKTTRVACLQGQVQLANRIQALDMCKDRSGRRRPSWHSEPG